MTWLVVWSSLLFALGLILGARLGIWLEERAAARKRRARREERRAARWLGQVRETSGDTVMPYRPTQLLNARHDADAAGPILDWERISPKIPYAFPPWSLLSADPPTLGEAIQAMIANANAVPSVRWLDRLEAGQ